MNSLSAMTGSNIVCGDKRTATKAVVTALVGKASEPSRRCVGGNKSAPPTFFGRQLAVFDEFECQRPAYAISAAEFLHRNSADHQGVRDTPDRAGLRGQIGGGRSLANPGNLELWFRLHDSAPLLLARSLSSDRSQNTTKGRGNKWHKFDGIFPSDALDLGIWAPVPQTTQQPVSGHNRRSAITSSRCANAPFLSKSRNPGQPASIEAMIPVEDLFVVRKIAIARKPDTVQVLRKAAGKLGREPGELIVIMAEFERELLQFLSRVANDNRRFIKADHVSMTRLKKVLGHLARAADSSRELKGIEKPAVLWLLAEHLETTLLADKKTAPAASRHGIDEATLSQTLTTFLFLLDRIKLSDRELINPKHMIRRGQGRPPETQYNELATALLRVWSDNHVSVNRSTKGYGVLALTKNLIGCLDISVKLYPKFNAAGKPYDRGDGYSKAILETPLFELNTESLLEKIKGPLETAAREWL